MSVGSVAAKIAAEIRMDQRFNASKRVADGLAVADDFSDVLKSIAQLPAIVRTRRRHEKRLRRAA